MNQNHLNTSLKDKVLQSLGLPEEGFEGKIRLLSPSENSIRLDILLFMAEGKIVNINDLTATEEQIDVQSALQRLRELDLIHWDQNSGDVNVAYPFSGVPTPHRVTLAGMLPAYSMCAIDALGIPSMFTDAVIESECAFCGEKITIDVKNNMPVANPDTVVVGLGTTDAAILLANRMSQRPFLPAVAQPFNFIVLRNIGKKRMKRIQQRRRTS